MRMYCRLSDMDMSGVQKNISLASECVWGTIKHQDGDVQPGPGDVCGASLGQSAEDPRVSHVRTMYLLRGYTW